MINIIIILLTSSAIWLMYLSSVYYLVGLLAGYEFKRGRVAVSLLITTLFTCVCVLGIIPILLVSHNKEMFGATSTSSWVLVFSGSHFAHWSLSTSCEWASFDEKNFAKFLSYPHKIKGPETDMSCPIGMLTTLASDLDHRGCSLFVRNSVRQYRLIAGECRDEWSSGVFVNDAARSVMVLHQSF
jgi:hypothetical protein